MKNLIIISIFAIIVGFLPSCATVKAQSFTPEQEKSLLEQIYRGAAVCLRYEDTSPLEGLEIKKIICGYRVGGYQDGDILNDVVGTVTLSLDKVIDAISKGDRISVEYYVSGIKCEIEGLSLIFPYGCLYCDDEAVVYKYLDSGISYTTATPAEFEKSQCDKNEFYFNKVEHPRILLTWDEKIAIQRAVNQRIGSSSESDPEKLVYKSIERLAYKRQERSSNAISINGDSIMLITSSFKFVLSKAQLLSDVIGDGVRTESWYGEDTKWFKISTIRDFEIMYNEFEGISCEIFFDEHNNINKANFLDKRGRSENPWYPIPLELLIELQDAVNKNIEQRE